MDMTNFTLLDTAYQEFPCRLIRGPGCGDTFTGLDCSTDGLNLNYTCELNIDIQNETSYTCFSCSNASSNNTLCSPVLKLSPVTVIFESAFKSLWLRVPSFDFCDLNTILCFSERHNRTLYEYIDASNESSLLNVIETFQCNYDFKNVTDMTIEDKVKYDWSFLFVIVFIIAGGVGNILVCLAVCLDKRLQNVTNYFLLSLAIADLLVSLFVMPMGAIPGFLGKKILFSYNVLLLVHFLC